MDPEVGERLARISDAIARLERKTDFILRHLHLEYADVSEDSVPPELAEVSAWLKQGKRLQAIAAYRKLTGADLDAAKAAIADLELGAAQR